MTELKEKTVEELRKMASRKKIEGRSKMNKTELVRALKKKSSTKKTMKRRKMRGGALTEEQIDMLVARNYKTNPMTVRYMEKDGSFHPSKNRIGRILRSTRDPQMIVIQIFLRNGTISDNLSSSNKECLTISEDGNMLIVDHFIFDRGRQAPPPPPRYTAPPPPPRYNAPPPPPRYTAPPPPPRYNAPPPPPRYTAPPPPPIRLPYNVQTAYRTLGVEPGLDFKAVRKAYLKIVLHKHPNKGGDPANFRRIQEAYEKIEQYEESKKSRSTFFGGKKKKSTTKKTTKRRKMRGGALSQEQIDMLVARNYQTNPLNIDFGPDGINQILRVDRMTGYNVGKIRVTYNTPYGQAGLGTSPETFNLVMNETGEPILLRVIPIEVGPVVAPAPAPAPVQSNRVNINAPNPPGISTHNDGECAICMEGTGTPGNVSNARKANLVKIRPCGHIFHRNCLEPVATGPAHRRICPLCRAPFRP